MPVLHTCRKEVDPGGRDPNSGPSNNYCFAWSAFKSKTTQVLPSTESRTIGWAPGDLYEQAKKVCLYWQWWPKVGQSYARMFNLHNHPKRGGWEPGGSGVSAVAFDCYGSMKLSLAANSWWDKDFLSSDEIAAARNAGRSFDIVLEIGIGRPGHAKVWVNGESNPRIDVSGVNTYWPNQTGYSLWEGIYNSNGVPSMQAAEFVPARVGRSHEEAQKDGVDWPIDEHVVWGAVSKSTGADSFRHITLPSRSTDLFRIPPSLGGTTPPPPVGRLNPKKVRRTDGSLWLEVTEDAALDGFYVYRDGEVITRTFDPKKSVKLEKPNEPQPGVVSTRPVDFTFGAEEIAT